MSIVFKDDYKYSKDNNSIFEKEIKRINIEEVERNEIEQEESNETLIYALEKVLHECKQSIFGSRKECPIEVKLSLTSLLT